MRRPFIAGNWKSNKDLASARALAGALREALAESTEVEIAVFPTFVHLLAVTETLIGSNLGVGAQNCHWEPEGAYTGEVGAGMIADVGCTYVILGHSERRAMFGDNSKTVNRKLHAALVAGLTPIVCVGETLEEREAGTTHAVVSSQIRESLAGLSGSQMEQTVIAYEPVWAIGTGKTATPQQAQEVHGLIRSLLGELHDARIAAVVRIQYGGSVKPDNAAELMSQADIDGALVGGASLEAASFAAIVQYDG